MLRSIQRLARFAALCGSLAAAPSLAVAGEWGRGEAPESGFGSGAVFVGRGEAVNRGVTFGFDAGRGVAVVGGRHGSFERYDHGRRVDVPVYGGVRYDGGFDGGYENRRPGARPIDRLQRRESLRDLNRARFEARREAFRDLRRVETDGSFVRLRDSGRIDRFERDPRYDSRRPQFERGFRGSRTLTTFDVGDWGGWGGAGYGIPYPASFEQGPPTVSGSVGPKILDVATERLDRRVIGPSGLDTVTTGGGAKIIRIAPGFHMARAETPKPAAPRGGGDGLGLQPWSTGWLRYCTRTHASFDPDLGTYVTEGGRVRFCTAE